MTKSEILSFKKYAAEQTPNLASTLALKYQQAMPGLIKKYGPTPFGTAFGLGSAPKLTGGSVYNKYVSAITGQESGGRYNVVNKQSGALGLYQFMPKTLKGMGYTGTTQQFLNNPKLQTEYMHKFTQNNAKQLGININAMTPQQVGYLAAAHYGGVGGARKLMKGNTGYGMTNFGGKTPFGYVNDITRKVYGK